VDAFQIEIADVGAQQRFGFGVEAHDDLVGALVNLILV
jgi:hypothetical protein